MMFLCGQQATQLAHWASKRKSECRLGQLCPTALPAKHEVTCNAPEEYQLRRRERLTRRYVISASGVT